LWVNGEKYVFSTEVLEAGAKLIEYFLKMQHSLKITYGNAYQESVDRSASHIKKEIVSCLEEFDLA